MSHLRAVSLWMIVLCSATASALAQTPAPAPAPGRAAGAAAPRASMTLSTTAFANGTMIPDKYTCIADAAALRPPLTFANVPAAAVSLALVMHDADVHPGRGMYDGLHWLVWDLPTNTGGLEESTPMGALPTGSVIGKNTSGMPPGFAREAAYAPPCAPMGSPHHYILELYALDLKIGLPATATRDDVLKAIDGHIVAKAAYTAVFNRR
jgi:Raf kinase inhibitor-like YbhB/YbcL family protein